MSRLLMSAVDEADDVGMLEPGDDLHFALELLAGTGFRLARESMSFTAIGSPPAFGVAR